MKNEKKIQSDHIEYIVDSNNESGSNLQECWVKVHSLEYLKTNNPYEFFHETEPIIIVFLKETWMAYTLRCPHKGAQMRVIDYSDGQLVCPLHVWHFDLREEGRELHNYANLMHYPTQTRDGELYVKIN